MLVINPKNATPTVALLRLTLALSDDFTLDGRDSISFTLPKDELATNRAFAIQLFQEIVHKKRHDYKPLFTLAKSSLTKDELTFDFTPPKLQLPKGNHFLIVLYGDQLPATPAPTPTAPAGAGGATGAPTPNLSPGQGQFVPATLPPPRLRI
ncbi:MAG: hypothetical protein NVS9B12_02300 [Vulcanimicrobiaceae bacterium]